MNKLTLFTILLTVVLLSCNKGKRTPRIVIAKSCLNFASNPMPNGICRFFYTTYEFGEAQEFNDSCFKYNIGDTIIGKSKF